MKNKYIYIYNEEELNKFIKEHCNIPSPYEMQSLIYEDGIFMHFRHITPYDILDYNNYSYVMYEDNGVYWLKIKVKVKESMTLKRKEIDI